MTKRLLSDVLLDKWADEGLLPPHTKRVVIDLHYSHVVGIFFQCVGEPKEGCFDDELLKAELLSAKEKKEKEDEKG